MSERSPSMSEVLRAALTARLEGVCVACPARVESYDNATQLLDAKPLVKAYKPPNDSGVREAFSLPVVRNVPVCFPAGGGFFLSLPIAVGDTVLLVFTDRSLDRWLDLGGEVDPLDARIHHSKDAVAIPGLHYNGDPLSGTSASDLVLGKEGGAQLVVKAAELELAASLVDLGGGAVDSAVKGDTYLSAEGTLMTALTTFVSVNAAAMAAIAAAIGSPALVTTAGPAAATAAGAMSAASTAFASAISSFTGAVASFKSTIVKVK